MKFELKEYNVQEKDNNIMNITFYSNQLYFNNQIIENKIEEVKTILNQYKDTIINLNNKRIDNLKGGIQKILNIQFDNDTYVYRIIGNTPDEENSNLYSEIKEKILKIIKR